MIVSHRRGFIFVKTRKTAGTSLEIALSQWCGDEDVISPITPEDEQKRSEVGARGPQNYRKPWFRYGPRDIARLVVKQKPAKAFYNHMSADRIRALVGPEVWSNYFTFCFERDPLDKALSFFHWVNRDRKRYATMTEFIDSGRLHDLSRLGGWGLYTDPATDQVMVDRVFRFEDLTGALREIAERLGLEDVPELVRTKHRSRGDRSKKPEEVLEPSEIEAIRAIFRKEIALMDYPG